MTSRPEFFKTFSEKVEERPTKEVPQSADRVTINNKVREWSDRKS